MDGFFLSENDIVEPNVYRSLELDDWNKSLITANEISLPLDVKPTDIHFTGSVYVEKATLYRPEDLKGEFTAEKASPVDWFKVLDSFGKEKLLSTFEQRHLTEQVVPEPITVMELGDQKVVCDEIMCENGEFTLKEQDSETVFKKDGSKRQLDLNPVVENRSNNGSPTIIVSDHKEQVNNGYERKQCLSRPVAIGDLFNNLCFPGNDETDNKTLLVDNSFGENLSSETEEMFQKETKFVVNDNDLTSLATISSSRCTAVDDQNSALSYDPSSENLSETVHNLREEARVEESCKKDSVYPTENGTIAIIKSEEDGDNVDHECKNQLIIDSKKLCKKLMKLLTPKLIPKCKMVKYDFKSDEKLPSFRDAFLPTSTSESKSFSQRDVELPDILTAPDENTDDLYLSLDEYISEDEDVEVKNEQIHEKDSDILIPEPEEKMITQEDETDNRRIKAESQDNPEPMETCSNVFSLDDELEQFLVSNMILDTDHNNGGAQFPDLSNNLGTFLRNDHTNEDINTLDAVYRNIFPRNLTGYPVDASGWDLKIPRQQFTPPYDNYGHFISNGNLPYNEDRQWQTQSNRDYLNPVHANAWQKNLPINQQGGGYMNEIDNRQFMNDWRLYRVRTPQINPGTFLQMKAVKSENHPEFGDLKFGSTTSAMVEVVDSSLNYDF